MASKVDGKGGGVYEGAPYISPFPSLSLPSFRSSQITAAPFLFRLLSGLSASNSFNMLHRGAALFQQYIVDIWLSIESCSIITSTRRSCAATCTTPPAVSCLGVKTRQQPADANLTRSSLCVSLLGAFSSIHAVGEGIGDAYRRLSGRRFHGPGSSEFLQLQCSSSGREVFVPRLPRHFTWSDK